MQKILLYGLAAVAAGCSSAPEGIGGPNPGDPALAGSPGPYRSALEGYFRYREPEPADWRQVNDEVAKAGGHVGIMRTPKERP